METISVITPVFNAIKYLPRLINSVQSQSNVFIEHIIVDDCSTDGGRELLISLAANSSNIKLILLDKNCGPVLARNRAIGIATGRFLAFLDADDVWLPNKSEIQIKFMLSINAAISFTDYRFISEDGNYIGRRVKGLARIGFSMHHLTRYLGCLTIIIDRNIVKNFFFPNISPAYRAEDFLAWSEVLKQFRFAYRCPEDLARYSQVANSRSSNAYKAAKSVWRLYRYVEKIPMLTASGYFIGYTLFTLFKRLLCKPNISRKMIDSSYFKLDI